MNNEIENEYRWIIEMPDEKLEEFMDDNPQFLKQLLGNNCTYIMEARAQHYIDSTIKYCTENGVPNYVMDALIHLVEVYHQRDVAPLEREQRIYNAWKFIHEKYPEVADKLINRNGGIEEPSQPTTQPTEQPKIIKKRIIKRVIRSDQVVN